MTPSPPRPSAGCAAVSRVDGSLVAAGAAGLSPAVTRSSTFDGGDGREAGSAVVTGASAFELADEAGGVDGTWPVATLRSAAAGRSAPPAALVLGSTRGGDCGRAVGTVGAVLDAAMAGGSMLTVVD